MKFMERNAIKDFVRAQECKHAQCILVRNTEWKHTICLLARKLAPKTQQLQSYPIDFQIHATIMTKNN